MTFAYLAPFALLPLSGAALAQVPETPSQTIAVASAPGFAQFAPGENPIEHTIDYSIWDFALKNLVVSMGPSLRKSAGIPDPILGTRIRAGHNSIYRLEGALVGFYFMTKEVRESFGEYRRDLEDTADLIDIQSLARNEQLAYWLNLHNVAMMEKMAEEWPVRQPRNHEIGGVPLDDLRFITVKGVAMSLRDIRENIVYRHWRNPKVIYGFWRGEIGSPAMQREAFNAANVSGLLDRSAGEFVNSLRGTQKRGSALHVSTLYEEVAPYYFTDFETDLREHLGLFANDEVKEILGTTRSIQANIREHDIADLSGGKRQPNYLNNGSSFRVPAAMARLLRQRQKKFEFMIRRGIRTGTVTFSNIRLPGDNPEDAQVE